MEEAIAGKLHRKHAASIPKPRVPRIDPQPHEYAGLDEDALMDALLMKPEAGDRSKREQTRNSAAAPPGSEPVLRKGAVQHPRGEPDVQVGARTRDVRLVPQAGLSDSTRQLLISAPSPSSHTLVCQCCVCSSRC